MTLGLYCFKYLSLFCRFQFFPGEYFDLREFHEQVLSVGPVPLSLLENHITKWVSDKKRYISVATTPATDVKLIMGLVATIFVLQQ